jgi:two-component system, OmpR family, copper resistance phosphate regulon response regulator CusR
MRILLVEDQPDAASILANGLREQTYAVDIASDGEQADFKAAVNQYDLIILDVMLPRKNGFEVCHDLRAAGLDVPILMVTARDDVEDRIRGIDLGADDYLVKPFVYRELLARVRGLLRRGRAPHLDVLEIGDLRIEVRARRVQRAGRLIDLTGKEFALLECLARRSGELVRREEISEQVWDETYDPFSNLIDVYVGRLRRKLDDGYEIRLLHTRRGEGYVLGANAEDAQHA